MFVDFGNPRKKQGDEVEIIGAAEPSANSMKPQRTPTQDVGANREVASPNSKIVPFNSDEQTPDMGDQKGPEKRIAAFQAFDDKKSGGNAGSALTPTGGLDLSVSNKDAGGGKSAEISDLELSNPTLVMQTRRKQFLASGDDMKKFPDGKPWNTDKVTTLWLGCMVAVECARFFNIPDNGP